MLVLRRNQGESIRIGTDIVVKIIHVSGDKVRVGIDAPHHVVIRREELPEHERSTET